MRHHPTWSEISEEFLNDPEISHLLDEYAPVYRDREAERARCEDTIPGYSAARLSE